MAEVSHYSPPGPMSFHEGNLSETWVRWLQQFDIYMECIEKEPTVSKLLNLMGEESIEIYNNMIFAQGEDKKNYETVKEKFDEYCQSRDPQLMLREQFWYELKRQDGQTFDQYLNVVKKAAINCKFTNTEQMVRDKLVFTALSKDVKAKLYREGANLTLEQTINVCRLYENTKRELEQVAKPSPKAVDAIRKKPQEGKPKTSYYGQRTKTQPKSSSRQGCGRCGRHHGSKMTDCKAHGVVCHKCSKPGHFQKFCRSGGQSKSKVYAVECTDEDGDDVQFYVEAVTLKIEDVTSKAHQTEAWFEKLSMAGSKVKVKLDTGAETNVLPLFVYNQLREKPPLTKSKVTLKGYGGHTVKHVGRASVTCEIGSKSGRFDFYVADVKSPPVIGLSVCKQLDLVRKGPNCVEIATVNVKPEASVKAKTKVTSSNATAAPPTKRQKPLTKEWILENYKDVFEGLGAFEKPYHIDVDPSVTPVIHAPRRVPFSVQERFKEKLDEMVQKGVIRKVDQPTDWVNSIVTVEKKNGELRPCLDPKDLNRAIRRERTYINTPSDVLARLAGKKVFTILDEKDSYWQVKLDEESQLLTTFNTPFGRYCFCRMPFGISPASEVLQKRNEETFGDISGVHCIADDMILAGDDDDDHDEIVINVLERARERNVKFNAPKLQFKTPEAKYVGSRVSADGTRPDIEKIDAVANMPKPECVSDVRRLMGLLNYLSTYIPNLTQLTAPIRVLLKKSTHWMWEHEQQEAYEKIKRVLVSEPVLRFFDPKLPVVIQCDASSTGLGACLLQDGQPVAYSSRSLRPAEVNYPQIEKELLAIVYATEKFHYYIYGLDVTVHSDHAPLETIVKKSLHKASPRLQSMLLKLLKYNLKIVYKPGKEMYIADTLSRAPLSSTSGGITAEESAEMEVRVHTLVASLPISDNKKTQLQEATAQDTACQVMMKYCRDGWPASKRKAHQSVSSYWKVHDEIHEADGLLFVGEKLLVPETMRTSILESIHGSHLGIEKCKARARPILYWPGMSQDIEDTVDKCTVCRKYRRNNQREPMIPHDIPDVPWAKLGSDILYLGGSDYIVIVDYYSKYPEVIKLKSKTAREVITKFKECFGRFGIPQEIIADNVPYDSAEMREFARKWGIKITTTSPRYPQANGFSEKYVQIVKQLYKKAHDDGKDPELALLDYRNTPISGMPYSPAQLLMSRRLRDQLPTSNTHLKPKVPVHAADALKRRQNTQKRYYDRGSKPLTNLKVGQSVRIKKGNVWKPAVVKAVHKTPRSYVVTSDSGQEYRRNRRHLAETPEKVVIQPVSDEALEEVLRTPPPPQNNLAAHMPAANVVSSPAPAARVPSPAIRTSTRVRAKPAWHKDYRM